MPHLKATTFVDYINAVSKQAGSDYAVGKYLGYSDGSRVGAWRKGGNNRPDELACVKLARWTGDDPLRILRLAQYDELADLLEGRVAVMPASIEAMRPTLVALEQMIAAALKMK